MMLIIYFFFDGGKHGSLCIVNKFLLFKIVLFSVRLIALAAQKFVADIVNDTMQLNKMKGSAQASRSSKSKEKK